MATGVMPAGGIDGATEELSDSLVAAAAGEELGKGAADAGHTQRSSESVGEEWGNSG